VRAAVDTVGSVSTNIGPEDQPTDTGLSEAEVRAYVEKLRSAPAEQLLVELLFTALNAAQVKLGRNDARLFIDFSSLMLDTLREYLPDDTTTQADQALGQLRLGQVQAESEIATSGRPEANDIERPPTGITTRPGEQTSAPPTPPPTVGGSGLWVPGRDR
jgi:hypothetical protein